MKRREFLKQAALTAATVASASQMHAENTHRIPSPNALSARPARSFR